MIESEGVLLVFTKTPEPGKTKTRLIPALGEEGAAKLHRLLLRNTLKQALRSQFFNVELWCTPSTEHPFLNECQYKFAVKLCRQEGDNLGQRMHNALLSALTRYPFAVIIGSDCPVLTVNVLNQAYEKLQQGIDAVIGPSEDRGYYLIGARKNDESLFKDIQWGSHDVADMTRVKLSTLGWRWDELNILWDVDMPEDLEKLRNNRPDLLRGLEAEPV